MKGKPVKGFCTFAETAGETVMDEGSFEDVAEGFFDSHAGL